MPKSADPRVESCLEQQHGVDVISEWYRDARAGRLGHTATLRAIRKDLGSANSRSRCKLKATVRDNRRKIAQLEADGAHRITADVAAFHAAILDTEAAYRRNIATDEDWTRSYLQRIFVFDAHNVFFSIAVELRSAQTTQRQGIVAAEAAEAMRLRLHGIARGQHLTRRAVVAAERAVRGTFDALFMDSWRRARQSIRAREQGAAERRRACAAVEAVAAADEPRTRAAIHTQESDARAFLEVEWAEVGARGDIARNALLELGAEGVCCVEAGGRLALVRAEATHRTATLVDAETSARFVQVLEQWHTRDALRTREAVAVVYVQPSHHAAFTAAAGKLQAFVRTWLAGRVGRTATLVHYREAFAGKRPPRARGDAGAEEEGRGRGSPPLTRANLRDHDAAVGAGEGTPQPPPPPQPHPGDTPAAAVRAAHGEVDGSGAVQEATAGNREPAAPTPDPAALAAAEADAAATLLVCTADHEEEYARLTIAEQESRAFDLFVDHHAILYAHSLQVDVENAAACVVGRCYRSYAARQRRDELKLQRELVGVERKEACERENIEGDWVQATADAVIALS